MVAGFNHVVGALRRVRAELLVTFFGLLLAAGQVNLVYAQTSTFTYQGRLTDGGATANGTYEMQFKLFDGASNQLGATITNSAVAVTDGVFTVQLDYGNAAFSGSDRFLEIAIRPAGSGNSFTVLSPRQQLTSAVYAIRAGSTASADNATTATNAAQLGGVAANQYVQTNDSRLNDARTPTAGSANYIQNGTVQQANSSFHISGNGVVEGTLAASNVNTSNYYSIAGTNILSASGQFNIFAGASAGLVNTGIANSFFGHQAGASNTIGALNTFVGTSTGQLNKDGNNNTFIGAQAGFKNTSGNSNTFIGENSGDGNISGFSNTFVGQNSGVGIVDTNYNTGIGYSAGEVFPGNNNTFIGAFANTSKPGLTNATAIGYNGKVSQSNSLVLGGIKDNNGNPDTNVGIGTTAPAFRFTVQTATSNYGMVHTDGTVIVGSFVGGSTGGGWFGTKSNHSLSFFVNDGGAAMTIETGGTVKINTLGSAGLTSLCRNALNQISTCSSSLRYKTNIQPFLGGLSVLNRLRPITFDWKQGGLHDLGFGAEDIAAVEPLLVTHNDKGEVEGVKYDRITAVLVNAVKEQQEQIKKQQSQLAQQQREIEELKSFLSKNPRRSAARSNARKSR